MDITMPPVKQEYDNFPARFAKGTMARAKALLRPLESQTDFIRLAVDELIERREKEKREKE